MHALWDAVIYPLLVLLRPSSIVEIGSEGGDTTRLLLGFCQRHGATLHAIDPAPLFDVVAWQQEYDRHFVFHRALSLDILPAIDRPDLVLIDGDHNWYTVFNELQMLEQRSTALGLPFPLVLLHDIDWPYGRRDLYYNPGTIPAEFRQPYQRKGMWPGSARLLEKGGFNAHLHNAVRENTPRNGVLTAVEDFLKEATDSLELIKLPGFHGLGILLRARLHEENLSLANFLDGLNLPTHLRRYIEVLEASRIDLQVQHADRSKITQEITAVVPPANTFILVGQDEWGIEGVIADRTCLPFLEHEGQYWGTPENDETAIRELERLRQSGANFVVFAWSAIWWLDYYPAFARHLDANYRRVRDNDHVVVFDLRTTA
jgi:hypothetical protein